MKNARHKPTHHLPPDQHLLGASSLAAATLHTIESRGGTPVQSPDDVSITILFSINAVTQLNIKRLKTSSYAPIH
jgi:hypothetical protein